MATYRSNSLIGTVHISRPAKILESEDDLQVRELATPFVDGLDIELWHKARLVAKCSPLDPRTPIAGA